MKTMKISTSGAASRDSAEIAMSWRGTPSKIERANRDELTMLVQYLDSAISKRAWLPMIKWTEVQFRGKTIEVVVDNDTGYDEETNSREIEWHFFGVEPEEHDAMEITDEENDDIFRQLCEKADGG